MLYVFFVFLVIEKVYVYPLFNLTLSFQNPGFVLYFSNYQSQQLHGVLESLLCEVRHLVNFFSSSIQFCKILLPLSEDQAVLGMDLLLIFA